MLMYNYVLEENNKIIVMEGDSQVGELFVFTEGKKSLDGNCWNA